MSWAEDMGYDNYEQTISDEDEWEAKDGTVTKIYHLETSHIQNIIRFLKKGNYAYGQGSKLDILEKELNRRGAK